eukprot:3674962-Rhodomonas_salina.1
MSVPDFAEFRPKLTPFAALRLKSNAFSCRVRSAADGVCDCDALRSKQRGAESRHRQPRTAATHAALGPMVAGMRPLDPRFVLLDPRYSEPRHKAIDPTCSAVDPRHKAIDPRQ